MTAETIATISFSTIAAVYCLIAILRRQTGLKSEVECICEVCHFDGKEEAINAYSTDDDKWFYYCPHCGSSKVIFLLKK